MSRLKDILVKLPDRIDLTEKEAEEVMQEIMHGHATDAQIAAYLMGLRMKGETIEEITGSVRAMRDLAIRVPISDPQVVDTCGTGGDKSQTFQYFHGRSICGRRCGDYRGQAWQSIGFIAFRKCGCVISAWSQH